jgi:phasin family protein
MAKDLNEATQAAAKRTLDETRRIADTAARAGEEVRQAGQETVQRATDTAQNNLQSLMQSGSVFAEGMQKISKEIFDCTQQSIQRQMAHVSELASCKTPVDLYTLQSQFVRENVEGFIASTQRISELARAMADETNRKISDGAAKR